MSAASIRTGRGSWPAAPARRARARSRATWSAPRMAGDGLRTNAWCGGAADPPRHGARPRPGGARWPRRDAPRHAGVGEESVSRLPLATTDPRAPCGTRPQNPRNRPSSAPARRSRERPGIRYSQARAGMRCGRGARRHLVGAPSPSTGGPMRRTRRHRGGAWIACLLLLPCALAGCGVDETPPDLGPAYDASGRAQGAVEHPGEPAQPRADRRATRSATTRCALGADAHSDARMPHLASLAARGVAFDNAVAAAPWTLPSDDEPADRAAAVGARPAHAPVPGAPRRCDHDVGRDPADHVRLRHGRLHGGPLVRGQRREHPAGLRPPAGRLQPAGHAAPALAVVARAQPQPSLLPRSCTRTTRTTPTARPTTRGSAGPCPTCAATRRSSVRAADEGEIFRRCYLDAGTTIALRDALGAAAPAGILHRYAHSGYEAAPRPELAADLEDAYWDGVRWTDGLLAQTTAYLERQGLLGNTLLVVTVGPRRGLRRARQPRARSAAYGRADPRPAGAGRSRAVHGGRVVTSSVGLVDVLPTFFDWAGLRAEGAASKGDRSPAPARRRPRCRPGGLGGALGLPEHGEAQDAIRMSVRTEHWKYIVTYDVGTGRLRRRSTTCSSTRTRSTTWPAGPAGCRPSAGVRRLLLRGGPGVRAASGARRRRPGDASHIPYGASNRQPRTDGPRPRRPVE